MSALAEEAEVVCGYCHIPHEQHPVGQCPYLYEPIRDANDELVLGYYMTRKDEDGKHG